MKRFMNLMLVALFVRAWFVVPMYTTDMKMWDIKNQKYVVVGKPQSSPDLRLRNSDGDIVLVPDVQVGPAGVTRTVGMKDAQMNLGFVVAKTDGARALVLVKGSKEDIDILIGAINTEYVADAPNESSSELRQTSIDAINKAAKDLGVAPPSFNYLKYNIY